MIVTNSDRSICPYDIGDVLVTASAAQPSARYPGTSWTQIKDCFLLAAGDSHEAGSTGGEETHTLRTEELPSHSHTQIISAGSPGKKGEVGPGTFNEYAWWEENRKAGETSYTGGNKPHNNMPPYLSVYCWKRTA